MVTKETQLDRQEELMRELLLDMAKLDVKYKYDYDRTNGENIVEVIRCSVSSLQKLTKIYSGFEVEYGFCRVRTSKIIKNKGD